MALAERKNQCLVSMVYKGRSLGIMKETRINTEVRGSGFGCLALRGRNQLLTFALSGPRWRR